MQTAATVISAIFLIVVLYGFFRAFWSAPPKPGRNENFSENIYSGDTGPSSHHSDGGGHGGADGSH